MQSERTSERSWQSFGQTDIREDWIKLFNQQQIKQQQNDLAKAEAAQKLQEAQAEAVIQERLRQQEQQILQEALKQEQARAQAKQEAEQAAFAERERALQAEVRQRAEAARKARAKEAEQRRIYAAQLQREAEEKRRQEQQLAAEQAAERRAREEERAQEALAERKALDRLRTVYALRTSGEVSIGPVASQRPNQPPLELRISVTAPPGDPATSSGTYFSADDITAGGLLQTAYPAVLDVTQQYESRVQLQQMSGQGALTAMKEPELRHWMRMTQCRALAALTADADALAQAGGFDRTARSSKSEVRTERAVLPAGHEKASDMQLSRVASQAAAGQSRDAQALLASVMDEEQELITKGTKADPPPKSGQVLALAFLLEQEGADSQKLAALLPVALQALRAALLNSPKDSLTSLAQVMEVVLGAGHPLMTELRALAETNMSEGARRRRLELQKLSEARHAAAILEEEYPDTDERKKASAAARDAATPIPERVWALRNVGTTLGLGEPAKGRQYLEKAVLLKRQWLDDDPRHPGVLPELEALRELLIRRPEWKADAEGVAVVQMGLFASVAERYSRKGELASAVVLLEAAVRRYEKILPDRSSALTGASRRAEQLLDALSPEQRQKVTEARRRADVLQPVISAFEEEVAARQIAATTSKKDLWNEGGLQPLPSLA
ncbi:hypothetical protein WJX73_003598 [Symbiochloris irregularis]|uniref:Uncharacterized protein n=1 Tax=Symbiochloris irregularis TaxID=706552 RepID=A0AAW1PVK3_9CHLO